MRKNKILGLIGLDLFFLVMTVLYLFLVYTKDDSNPFIALTPLIVFSGFFIFLVGAILVALSISKIIDKRYSKN